MAYRKIDASVDEEMLALRKSGMGYKAIADKLGLGYGTVYRRLNSGSKETKQEEPKPEPTKIEEKPTEPAFDPAFDVEHTRRVAPTPVKPQNVATIATIATKLFDFAYVPVINEKLYKLSRIAIPEPWKFKDMRFNNPRNPETPILEQYVFDVFRKRAEEYNTCPAEEQDKIILLRKNFCCFHTGLYTPDYQGIYAYFTPCTNPNTGRSWYFFEFLPQNAYQLRGLHPLPEHRRLLVDKAFNPTLPVSVNTGHILENEKNVERLPDMVKNYWNGQLLLETAIELARRQAVVNPRNVVSSAQMGENRFLLPLYITGPDTPDIVALFTERDGYNHLRTCLTPAMAYATARADGRPTVDWLRALVE